MKNKKIHIVCTLGPGCVFVPTLNKMSKAGMTIARINFSHGDDLQHAQYIKLLRTVNQQSKEKVSLLQDLEGFRIRIGEIKKPLMLKIKDQIWMTNEEVKGNQEKNLIPIDFKEDLKRIKKNLWVFVDDGRLALKVLESRGHKIRLEVMVGGLLKKRKGVNIPGLELHSNILTDKDLHDLNMALPYQLEYVAQSFVRHAEDLKRVIDRVRPYSKKTKFIAKIENEEGLKNLDEIISLADGIIVARGDLGVSLPIYKIPLIQKEIIRRCNKHKKFVITATQMLESMIESFRPTRAEVTDVANAILDGTDGVMLSAETAVGQHPVECVKMMKQIVQYTRKYHPIMSFKV